jgi:23S rRNA (adenine2503-C2)-methyltransferase
MDISQVDISQSGLTEAERVRILAKTARFNPPPAQLADGRRDLVGMSRAELAGELAAIGEKPFRTKQVWHWIYHQGVTDFSRMSSIARPLQEKLAEHFVIGRPVAAVVQTSSDETRKFLFRFRDGQEAETVYIPDAQEDRGAVCISSQVGCTLSCRFCHTGTQALVRNLGAAEIVGQFMAARDNYGEWPSPRGETPRLLSTIVLMGMGEPLQNYSELVPALRVMLDDHGYGLSRRRVTVSTSGVVPMMDRLAHDCPVALAVSLHAPNDALRDDLVPLNKKYSIADLLDACNRYLVHAPRDYITFEYCMLAGVNDQAEHAHQLVSLVRRYASGGGVWGKFNLIPFNPFPESGLSRSSSEQVRSFARILSDAGIVTTIRKTRGEDIDAACGQLAGAVKDRTRVGERIARQRSFILKPVATVKETEI